MQDDLNRDVNQAQTMETNIDLRPINFYATNLNTEELKKSIPRDADGNINFGAVGESIYDTVKSYTYDPIASFFSSGEEEEINLDEPKKRLVEEEPEPEEKPEEAKENKEKSAAKESKANKDGEKKTVLKGTIAEVKEDSKRSAAITKAILAEYKAKEAELEQKLIGFGLSKEEAHEQALVSWKQIKKDYRNKANPGFTNVAGPLVIAPCASNPLCVAAVGSFVVVGTKIITDALQRKMHQGKPTILSTPIHDDKGQVLTTPPTNKQDTTLATPIPDDILDWSVETYPVMDGNEHFKLPGFEIPENIDLSVLEKVRIDGNDIVSVGDLIKEHEGGSYNGHLGERHLDKTKGYLIDRKVKQASSFPNIEIATDVVTEVLQRNVAQVKDFESNALVGRTKTFTELSLGKMTGYGTRNGQNDISPRYGAKVVLVKTEEGTKILTGFPIGEKP
jgi:hypothetical protein